MEIDKFVYFNKLYSVYRDMLTEKQRDILELYLLEDFSLGEISDELGISRQAVHDAVKRSEQLMFDTESRLGILKKEKYIADKANLIIGILNSKDTTIDNDSKNKILDVCKELI